MITIDWMNLIGSEGNSERPILTCNEEGHSRAQLGQGIQSDPLMIITKERARLILTAFYLPGITIVAG